MSRRPLLHPLAHLLVQTLATSGDRLSLAMPMLRDLRLPMQHVGAFDSLLGGQRDEMFLFDLLDHIAREHEVRILTTSPARRATSKNDVVNENDLRRRLHGESTLEGTALLEDLMDYLDARTSEASHEERGGDLLKRQVARLTRAGVHIAYGREVPMMLAANKNEAMAGGLTLDESGGLKGGVLSLIRMSERDHLQAWFEAAWQEAEPAAGSAKEP